MTDKNQDSSEEDTIEVQYCFFMVDEEPYCVWDFDIKSVTLHFIENIDTTYFEYIADTHINAAVSEKSLLASIALRATYSQALETFFAFIGAAVQAPLCVPAWVNLYRPGDLENIVKKSPRNRNFHPY